MADEGRLEREARVLARHLGVAAPSDAVLHAYVRAHHDQPGRYEAHGFDARLVALARRGPFLARVADAYARLRRPRGALRRKLVLCLALLETTDAGSRALDEPQDVGRARLAAELSLALAGGLGALLLGLLLLGPLELVSGGGDGR